MVSDKPFKTQLVVSIDTEEEGLWGGTYRMTGNTVDNLQHIGPFQDLCDRLGIRPTYLIDAPVVQDDEASQVLADIHGDGRCEIGTHVHPWCNPPFDDVLDCRESYLCNLPTDLQRAKIEWLTDAITDRFGGRPTSFRAGRYGFDSTGASILANLGYRVDSSVIPFMDYSAGGGLDFRDAPWQPYFVGDELQQASQSGALVELPVSVGFNRADFAAAQRWHARLSHPVARRLRLEGIFDRTQLLRKIKLSPEKASSGDMQTLVDKTCESSPAVLVMMFHSSSLMPGQSPYVRNEADLQEFLSRIEETCRYCLERHAAQPATLTEAGDRWRLAHSKRLQAAPKTLEVSIS